MIGLASTLRGARLQLVLDAIDLYADEYDTAKLQIYSGPRVSTGAVPDEYDNELLAELAFGYPCGTIADGVLTFNEMEDGVGLAHGDAVWGRILNSNDEFVMDLSVSGPAGDGDIRLDSVTIEIGIPVEFISGALTEGNP